MEVPPWQPLPRRAPKIGRLDVKRSQLETFAINERANQKLIEVWTMPLRTLLLGAEKGRTIAGIACHTGCLIAHDSHHRGQISMLAHQMDMPVPSKISLGLWESGTLWKECRCKR